jgi:hypothetical protein
MSATKFPIVLDAHEVGTIANHASDDETIDFACHARGPFFLAGPWAFVSLLINHSWWIVLKRSQPGTPSVHDNATPARSPVPTS